MENENRSFNPEYYSDEYVAKETERAVDFIKKIFEGELEQMEYLKLRQIAKEIQEGKTMTIEDTYGRPMWTEIVARFIHDCYGQDLNVVSDMAGEDWDKVKKHLQVSRQQYLDE